MHRRPPLALSFLAFIGLVSAASATPQWIWGNRELATDGKRQEARLRKDIEVPPGVTKATWTVAADAQAILLLDGRELGSTPNVGEAEAVDLTPLFAGRAAGKRTLGLKVYGAIRGDSQQSGRGGRTPAGARERRADRDRNGCVMGRCSAQRQRLDHACMVAA